MKVINKKVNEEGMVRELVKNGYGDIKIEIGEEEIISVKSILCSGNKLFNKLVKDEKFAGSLELNENISVSGYYLLERYLSGLYIEISDENVLDLLCISLFYEENVLNIECQKYIGNHINEKILLDFLKFVSLLNINQLNEYHILTDNYIYENGYKYIYNNELMYELSVNAIYYLLNSKRIIVNEENDILKLIIEYDNKEKEVRKSKIENMNKLYESINWNKIELKSIEDKEKMMLQNNKIDILSYLNNNIKNRIYINLNKIDDNEMKYMILKYYTNVESVINLKESDINKLKEMKDLSEIINELLLNEDEIVNMIGIIIIIDLKMNYEIKNSLKRDIFNKLLYFYSHNTENLKRESVPKSLILFIEEDKDVCGMYKICGTELLYKLINFIKYTTKEIGDMILEFTRGLRYDSSIEDYEMMDRIILDNSLIEPLKMIKMTEFYYPRKSYCFRPGEEISVKPSTEVKDSVCIILPNLPDGLSLDCETGEIKGKVDKETEQKKYTIKCSNIRNSLSFIIYFEIHDYKFKSSCNSNYLSMQNGYHRANRLVYTCYNGYNNFTESTGWYNAYVDLKMEKGIYHIKYQYYGNSGNNNIALGATTSENYSGAGLYSQANSYSICLYNNYSSLINHNATIVNQPNITNHTSGSEYEVIFDMRKHEFSIIHDDKEILLMKDLPSPLYPFVENYNGSTYIDLISVSREEESEEENIENSNENQEE